MYLYVTMVHVFLQGQSCCCLYLGVAPVKKNYKCNYNGNVYLHVYNSLGSKTVNTSPANAYALSWIHMILNLTMAGVTL